MQVVAYGSVADVAFSLEPVVEAAALVYPLVLVFIQCTCRLSMGSVFRPAVLLYGLVQAVLRVPMI